MPATLDEFIHALIDCGLMTAEEVRAFIMTLPPDRRPVNAAELATEMFRQKKLTKYQAQAIYQGKTRALVMGNYVVLERLGTGGMGQVFKAQHRRMERIVAIKILPPETTRSEEAVKRFHREVKAAARLVHPNIVTAYDADEARGVHFLVMEHVDGENLSALVKRSGPMPVQQALACAHQAAKGLEYAHGEGVIHRDIKPSNLLLDKRGTIKILDMGLARIEETMDADALPAEELTQAGYVMGSVDYMSPEQGFDLRTTDHRSDIYSLGATFYYLLTGQAMYKSNTMVKRILAHRDQPIPSLRAARADVPEGLDAVFQWMVAKRPEDRPQSMTDVIARLEGCLSGGPRTDGPPVGTAMPLQPVKEDTVPPSPIASLLDEWLLEEPGLPTEPISTPFSIGLRRRTRRRIIIGALCFALAVLTWILADLLLSRGSSDRLQTSEGMLVVEVSEPNATVQVFDNWDKLEIARTSNGGPVSILVNPGQHRLKVQKDGFQPFGQDVTVRSGETNRIKVALEPSPTN